MPTSAMRIAGIRRVGTFSREKYAALAGRIRLRPEYTRGL